MRWVTNLAAILAVVFLGQSAASAANLLVLVNEDGRVTVSGAEGRVATVDLGIYDENWVLQTPTPAEPDPSLVPNNQRVRQGKGRTSRYLNQATPVESGSAVGPVSARTEVLPETDGFSVRVTATATRDFTPRAAGIRVLLAAPTWAGGSISAGGTSLALPLFPSVVTLGWLNGTSFSIQNGAQSMSVETSAPATVRVQDNRQWGPQFELRVGAQNNLWPTGQIRVFEVRVRTATTADISAGAPISLFNGSDWNAMPAQADIRRGTVLDLSQLNSRPADRRILAQGDGFIYEGTGEPARFYGANLAYGATWPDRQLADRVATRLSALGFNSVRFHHFDQTLLEGQSASDQLRADRLDRMDYFVSALKQRGIYVTLDLLTLWRPVGAESAYTDLTMEEAKVLVLFNTPERTAWRKFADALMNHVNPYTGLAWKSDPAVAWISLSNEDYLGNIVRRCRPAIQDLVNQAYQAAGNSGNFDPQTPEGARWCAAVHLSFFNAETQRLKDQGAQALFTTVNGLNEPLAMAIAKRDFDYVDQHLYWDHPVFLGTAWNLPARGGDEGVSPLSGWFGNRIGHHQIQGKPFVITEWGVSMTNSLRYEMALLVPVLASVQGWDGVWRFAWSSNDRDLATPTVSRFFESQNDPLGTAVDRLAALIYRRGDIPTPSSGSWRRVDPATASNEEVPSQLVSGIFSRPIGLSTTVGDISPAAVPPVRPNDWGTVDGSVIASPANLFMSVQTSRTCMGVASENQTFTAGVLQATLAGSRASVVLTSLDGLALRSSRRMVLAHLVDLQNVGRTFSAQDRQVLTNYGSLPYLVKDASATIRVTVNNPARYRVWRLDLAGRRVSLVSTTVSGNQLVFTANTGGASPTFFYEITQR